MWLVFSEGCGFTFKETKKKSMYICGMFKSERKKRMELNEIVSLMTKLKREM